VGCHASVIIFIKAVFFVFMWGTNISDNISFSIKDERDELTKEPKRDDSSLPFHKLTQFAKF
jgi:hypothetical protein